MGWRLGRATFDSCVALLSIKFGANQDYGPKRQVKEGVTFGVGRKRPSSSSSKWHTKSSTFRDVGMVKWRGIGVTIFLLIFKEI